jgi:hypothetical protein
MLLKPSIGCWRANVNQFAYENVEQLNQKIHRDEGPEVWNVGLVNYLDALNVQEKIAFLRKSGRIPDSVVTSASTHLHSRKEEDSPQLVCL